jgi:hypothetical protein
MALERFACSRLLRIDLLYTRTLSMSFQSTPSLGVPNSILHHICISTSVTQSVKRQKAPMVLTHSQWDSLPTLLYTFHQMYTN